MVEQNGNRIDKKLSNKIASAFTIALLIAATISLIPVTFGNSNTVSPSVTVSPLYPTNYYNEYRNTSITGTKDAKGSIAFNDLNSIHPPKNQAIWCSFSVLSSDGSRLVEGGIRIYSDNYGTNYTTVYVSWIDYSGTSGSQQYSSPTPTKNYMAIECYKYGTSGSYDVWKVSIGGVLEPPNILMLSGFTPSVLDTELECSYNPSHNGEPTTIATFANIQYNLGGTWYPVNLYLGGHNFANIGYYQTSKNSWYNYWTS